MTAKEIAMIKQSLLLNRLLIPACLLLGSCQTFQEPEQPHLAEQELTATLEQQKEELKRQNEQMSPPEEVQNALMPPMTMTEETEEPEARFDLAVNNAPAREFFLGLVEGSEWNAVISPEVTGEITLDLKDVTISLVMDIVRDMYGYEYTINQNVYQVFPADLKTVLFPVNYLNVKRMGSSIIRVNSGEVADNYSSGSTNNSSNNSSNQIKRAGGNNSDGQHGTQIETSTENDFWKELSETLTLLVAGNDQAKVVTSPQTSMVIVRALPAEIRTVADYLRSIQSVLDRQVLLEAKILEVILGDSFQAGIDWSSIATVNTDNSITFSQNGQTVINPGLSSVSGGIFSMSYQGSNFDMMIDLLETQGLVQVLSSPRISTVNNQKAVIKVGTDEFFVTDISSTTIAGAGSSTTSPDVTLTPFFSGIALDVTPQIDMEGNIVLHVHPSISEVEDQEKLLTLGGDQLTLPLAKSTIRESDSIIRARSGEVVVIGGLMQTQTLNNDSGVPLLNDIPVAGKLFNQKRISNHKTELVILIRPIIVNDQTTTNYLQKSRQRVGNMSKGGR
ncbi:MAG: pilus (MSHA type) biogenesis protein MshL [Gammaproteobacteria bacterium]|nr:pilus (MSHA type) biogenesis protein MshL [Gammaproteobacteria bacterium]